MQISAYVVHVGFAFNMTPSAAAFTGLEKIITKPIARNIVNTEIKLFLFLIKLSQDFVTQKYNLHIYNDTIKM